MRTSGITLLLALLVATGCTTAHTFPTRGEQLSHDVTFSGVAVSIDDTLHPDALSAFRQHRGAHLLHSAFVDRLESKGRLSDSAPYRIELRVIGLRLRSWSDTLLGGDAGGTDDFLTIDVVVLENDDTALHTGATVSSNRGAFRFHDKHRRLDDLAQTIADTLTTEL